MDLTQEFTPFNESGLTKNEYFKKMLRNYKNVVLNKKSALMYYHLSNTSSDSKISVYSCVDLPKPFSVTRVPNFNGIEYVNEDGMMITTVTQTINDMLADETCDPQPLIEALARYYFTNNESFDGLEIYPENSERFQEMSLESVEYYNED